MSQPCLGEAPSCGTQMKSSTSIVTLKGTSNVTRVMCSTNTKDGSIYI